MRLWCLLAGALLIAVGCDAPKGPNPSPAGAIKKTNEKLDQLLKQNEQRNQQIEGIANEAISPNKSPQTEQPKSQPQESK